MEFRDLAGAVTPGCVEGKALPATILFDALTGTQTEKSRRVNLTDLPSISVIWTEMVMVISPLRKLRKDRRKGVGAADLTTGDVNQKIADAYEKDKIRYQGEQRYEAIVVIWLINSCITGDFGGVFTSRRLASVPWPRRRRRK